MIRVYIRSVAVGVALACGFVAALLALDVAHLRHLILDSDVGWLAVILLVVFNAIVFGGVQFALVVMGQAEAPPTGGTRKRLLPRRSPVHAQAVASTPRKRG